MGVAVDKRAQTYNIEMLTYLAKYALHFNV